MGEMLEMPETQRQKWKFEMVTKRKWNSTEMEMERQTFPYEMGTKRS